MAIHTPWYLLKHPRVVSFQAPNDSFRATLVVPTNAPPGACLRTGHPSTFSHQQVARRKIILTTNGQILVAVVLKRRCASVRHREFVCG